MKSKLTTLSKKLISIPSSKENPQALKDVLQVVKTELKEFKCKSYSKNSIPSLLFYNTKTLPKKFKIILNAHLDVVPAKPAQYKPLIKGNRLYGRGSYDMKAAAAAQILAFKSVANKINYPLGLQLVTDEEVGGFNGAKHQLETDVKADFALAGEPRTAITYQAKGIVWTQISTTGTATHAAYLWQGENAIWKMQRFLTKLDKTFPTPKTEKWQTTVNLASISTSNQTLNKVADDCQILLDIRYIPQEEKTIIKKLKSILPVGFKLKVKVFEPPHYTNPKNPFIKSLRKQSKQITKQLPPLHKKCAASDMRHFTQKGINAITFGPQGHGAHQDDEWVNLKSLNQYFTVLKSWLLNQS